MTTNDAPIRLLGLVGSLRREAYSRAVLRGLAEALPPDVELALRDVRLPLYDADADGDAPPPPVGELRAAIAASDGLVVATPEYNHGMPGVLKNALDWASRPFGRSTLTGKPFLVVSSSPAFTGGVRAQTQVVETLLAVAAVPLLGPQVVIGDVAAKVRDGRLVDAPSLEFALAAIARLAALCRRIRADAEPAR
ncbi:MAG TPA: NAD(P)H-dependent oxidoreductase [Dokdonella sp.]